MDPTAEELALELAGRFPHGLPERWELVRHTAPAFGGQIAWHCGRSVGLDRLTDTIFAGVCPDCGAGLVAVSPSR